MRHRIVHLPSRRVLCTRYTSPAAAQRFLDTCAPHSIDEWAIMPECECDLSLVIG